MKLRKIECISCGHPLSFDKNNSVVTCKYCGSVYSIEYDGSNTSPHVKSEDSYYPYILKRIEDNSGSGGKRNDVFSSAFCVTIFRVIIVIAVLIAVVTLLRIFLAPTPNSVMTDQDEIESSETVILPPSSPNPTPTASSTQDSTKNREESTSFVSISALKSIGDTPRLTDRLTDNYGNIYKEAIINNHGYSGSAGPIIYEYLINGKYHYLKGVVYVPEEESDDGTSTLTIRGDGRTLYASSALDKRSKPESFEINVDGFNDIEIEWSNNSGYSNISSLDCCLADSYFVIDSEYEGIIKNQSEIPYSILDFESTYTKVKNSKRLTDNFGNKYSNAIYNRVDYSHGNITPIYDYILNKRFKMFTGTIYVPEGLTFDNPVRMHIYTDDSIAYTSPAFTSETAPVRFAVDVSGVTNLKITYTACSWFDSNMDQTICLADGLLIP